MVLLPGILAKHESPFTRSQTMCRETYVRESTLGAIPGATIGEPCRGPRGEVAVAIGDLSCMPGVPWVANSVGSDLRFPRRRSKFGSRGYLSRMSSASHALLVNFRASSGLYISPLSPANPLGEEWPSVQRLASGPCDAAPATAACCRLNTLDYLRT